MRRLYPSIVPTENPFEWLQGPENVLRTFH